MQHVFIINPTAGGGKRAAKLESEINRVCKERNEDYLIYKTKGICDASEFVRRHAALAHPMRFYACGGDGTFCEVISGAPTAKNVSFGLIPIGTGNDFHRNFSGGDCFFDIAKQLDGTPIPLDLYRCNDDYGVNMVNIGFDCDVVSETVRTKKNPLIPSKMAYIAGLVKVFCRKIGTNFRLVFPNGESFDHSLTLSLIANGAFCGGGFKAAPYASLSDGLLEVCIIGRVSRMQFIRTVGPYKKGTYLDENRRPPFVTYKRTDRITVEFHEEHDYCIDGEVRRARTLDIASVPSATTFIYPLGASPVNLVSPLSTKMKKESGIL